MTEPLVSIIIPVYNAEKFLAATIQSAINQTWQNKEIIIIDDGSTDNSLAIAKTFEEQSVKVFSQKNKGAGAARNKGLREAKGEYIQFLDADDLLNKIKIEVQVKQLLKHPKHLALCGTVHFQNGTDPQSYPLNHEWYSNGSDNPADFLINLYGGDLIGENYGGMVQPNAWLIPAYLIKKAGYWNESLSVDDDGEFFCRVILAGEGISYLFEGINYYRKSQTGNSLSAQKSYNACNSILQSTQLKANYLLANTNNPKAKTALSRLFWEIAVSFYPQYTDLYQKATQLAKQYDPGVNPKPYKTGLKNIISSVIGWQNVKLLIHLKAKI